MKLQLALDELTLPEALVFIDKVVDDVDIIEVGTPFLIREGVNAIKVIKEKYPHKEVLVDAKIMDGGHFESQLLFDAGADYVTVLGVTDLLTIQSCICAAKEAGKQVVVDMICVDDLPSGSASWKRRARICWRYTQAPTSRRQGASRLMI